MSRYSGCARREALLRSMLVTTSGLENTNLIHLGLELEVAFDLSRDTLTSERLDDLWMCSTIPDAKLVSPELLALSGALVIIRL